jgi:hypothetical protein
MTVAYGWATSPIAWKRSTAMELAIFGSTNAAGFAPGWTNEQAIVAFGSAYLDLTKQPPAPDATLTTVNVFGSTKIVVPAGSRVRAEGFALFGSRRVTVTPADGPTLRLRFFVLFGSVMVVEGAPLAQPVAVASPGEGHVFPY